MASLTDECSKNKKLYLGKQIKEENNQRKNRKRAVLPSKNRKKQQITRSK
jgi:hypothetical protein